MLAHLNCCPSELRGEVCDDAGDSGRMRWIAGTMVAIWEPPTGADGARGPWRPDWVKLPNRAVIYSSLLGWKKLLDERCGGCCQYPRASLGILINEFEHADPAIAIAIERHIRGSRDKSTEALQTPDSTNNLSPVHALYDRCPCLFRDGSIYPSVLAKREEQRCCAGDS